MECPICKKEMEREESTVDYNDPNDPYGHGQYTQEVWYCEKCDHSEPYIQEDEYEPDEDI